MKKQIKKLDKKAIKNIHRIKGGIKIPEKVVMEKEGDFY